MTFCRWLSRANRTTLTSSVVTAATELLFPTDCRICRDAKPPYGARHPFCDACLELILAPLDRTCRRCAAVVGPMLPTDDCTLCRDENFVFRRSFACHRYRSELREIVLHAKRPGGAGDAVLLAKLLADRLKPGPRGNDSEAAGSPEQSRYDLIVSVPSDRVTRWMRPYQMSDVIADTLGRQLSLPVAWSALRKVRRTQKQAMISPSARRTNVRNAFTCRRTIAGLAVLLVDDVMTTGATANECAKALIASGAAVVDVAVIARGDGT